MAFGVWDYVVFISTLCVSAGIGVYVRFSGGRQKTANVRNCRLTVLGKPGATILIANYIVKEYLLADRSMPILPVAFSLMASFISSITLLGVSSEIYQFGTQFVIINISYGLATPIVAYLYLPVFYKLNATSAYEYLEKRFGKATRLAASLSYSLQMIMYMGIVLFAPALALEALTGLNRSYSILLVGTVCTFYSTIGGMKAVLLTDVFQSLLMYAAVLAIIISGVIYAGSFGEIFRAAEEGGRLELWNFNPDPTVRHSWVSILIGSSTTYLTLYAVNQAQIQRLLTVKDLKSAQMAVWLNWPILSLLSLSTAFSGLVIYYYYRTCDPLTQGRITSMDQQMPRYVIDALGHLPGIPGMFVAGIFSGSLSSVSSTLNSLSAVTLEDYFKPLYKKIKKKEYEETSAFLSKMIALVYGVVCIGGAFLAQFLGGILQASLILFGVVGGPLLGLFTLGMTTEIATQWGVIPGLFIGIGLSVWLGFSPGPPPEPILEFSTEDCSQFGGFNGTVVDDGGNEDGKSFFYLYRISYMYAAFIGFLLTFIIGITISAVLRLLKVQGKDPIFTDDTQTTINPDLFLPPKASSIRKRNLVIEEKAKQEVEMNEKY